MFKQRIKNKKKSSTEGSLESPKDYPQGISLSVGQAYQLALQNFQAGNLHQAEKLCQKLLKSDPDNAKANHLLGVIFVQQGGKEETAVIFIRKALLISPDFAEAHSNLGLVLRRLGKLDEAIASYRKALSISPNNTKFHNNLGNVFQDSGMLDEAVACYRKALLLNPDYPEAYNNLGVVLQKSDQDDKALASFKKALSLNPGYAEAYNNLGYLFYESGKAEEAIDSFNKAISINPNYVDAHNNLGRALQKLNKTDEAIASYSQALTINPNFAEAHNNLGAAYQKSGNLEEAVNSYQKAISLKYDYAEAHNNLGFVFLELNKLSASEASFREAIAIKPDYVEPYYNLGLVLQKLNKFEDAILSYQEALSLKEDYAEAHSNLGLVYCYIGMLDEAVSCQRKALQIKDDYIIAHSNLLFMMNYCPQITQQEIFEESLAYAEKHATAEIGYSHFLSEGNDINRKLRVGYISPDFSKHSVSFFIKPLLTAHNREKFEIFCYSDVKKPDIVTSQIEAVSDHWVPIVGKTDEDVIIQIKNDCIDILVDLTGHTGNNRLQIFANKPAPIQVSWLGYPNTSGIAAIDYRLTDAIADPVGTDDEFYSEELIRLQDCFLCYQPYEASPEIAGPHFQKNGVITFGSFNNLPKINSEVVKVWSKILLGVPHSRLVLKSTQLVDDLVRKTYLAMFAEEGILPDRIELLGFVPEIFDHLAIYNKIDIALDPFPYNGTTTTCEALWMGVPVVTLLGDRHAARVGASILHAIGIAENLLSDSRESYIEQAINLAADKESLINFKKHLRQQMKDSLLCDALPFAKKVEEAYQIMWARYTGINDKKDKEK